LYFVPIRIFKKKGKVMGYYDYKPEPNVWSDKVIKWIADIITVALFAFFIVSYLGDRSEVIGSSMAPGLESSQVVLIDKLSYELREPDRFDVIIYRSKTGDQKCYVKRIIALPGETVQIIDNQIYITSREGEKYCLEDKYCQVEKFESGYADEPVTVGSNEYFVLGDNRNLSEDSRFSYVGNIKKSDILGKAWLIASPFGDIGFVK